MMEVFRKSDRYLRRSHITRTYYTEILDGVQHLNKTLLECSNEYAELEKGNGDILKCRESLQKANEISERLLLLTKRMVLDDHF